jgi:hypothetical protein
MLGIQVGFGRLDIRGLIGLGWCGRKCRFHLRLDLTGKPYGRSRLTTFPNRGIRFLGTKGECQSSGLTDHTPRDFNRVRLLELLTSGSADLVNRLALKFSAEVPLCGGDVGKLLRESISDRSSHHRIFDGFQSREWIDRVNKFTTSTTHEPTQTRRVWTR